MATAQGLAAGRGGGQGGGVCRLKGKVQVFVDLDADPEVRYTTVLSGLAGCADLADMYILPEIRADLERANCGETRQPPFL